MAHDRRAEFGFDPEKLVEKYCPVCGELRPVRTEPDFTNWRGAGALTG